MTDLYEEWIAHHQRPQYILVDKHSEMSCRPGWWFSGWRGDMAAVTEAKRRPYVEPATDDPAA